MKKVLGLFLLLGTAGALAPTAHAGVEYQGKLQSGLTRGLKNVIGAPLEIPVTMMRYSSGQGRPVIRETAGFVDGFFRMFQREVSGLFDTVLSFVPGEQDGYPMDPETLF